MRYIFDNWTARRRAQNVSTRAAWLTFLSLLVMLVMRSELTPDLLAKEKMASANFITFADARSDFSWRLPSLEENGLKAYDMKNDDAGRKYLAGEPVGMRLISTDKTITSKNKKPLIIIEEDYGDEENQDENGVQLGENENLKRLGHEEQEQNISKRRVNEATKRKYASSGSLLSKRTTTDDEAAATANSAVSAVYMVSPISGNVIEVGKGLQMGRSSKNYAPQNLIDSLIKAATLASGIDATNTRNRHHKTNGNLEESALPGEFVYKIEHNKQNIKIDKNTLEDKQFGNNLNGQQVGEQQSVSFYPREPNKVNECHTIKSTILLNRDQYEHQPVSASDRENLATDAEQGQSTTINLQSTNKLVRSCKGLVKVNRCEGFCSSIVQPSIKSRFGFKKECSCCNEGSMKRVKLRLTECYSAIDNRRISSEDDEQNSYMDIEVEEPVDCKCRRCTSVL